MPRAKKIVPEPTGDFVEVDDGPNPGPHEVALAGTAHAKADNLRLRTAGAPPIVRFRRLKPEATLPTQGSAQASGWDVSACIPPGAGGTMAVGTYPVLIPTGLAVEVPDGYDLQLRGRSGAASRGLFVQAGTIDCDFRGEIFVCMHSASGLGYHTVKHGDRIGQLVLVPLARFVPMEVEALSETVRGGDGWGSTGR